MEQYTCNPVTAHVYRLCRHEILSHTTRFPYTSVNHFVKYLSNRLDVSEYGKASYCMKPLGAALICLRSRQSFK